MHLNKTLTLTASVRRSAQAICLIGITSQTTACILSPGSESTQTSTSSQIRFEGAVFSPRSPVTLEAAPSASGGFTSWRGSSVMPSAESFQWGSYRLHLWRLNAAVPAGLWGSEEPAPGCEVPTTYVRGKNSGLNMFTFDEPGLAVASCLRPYTDDLIAGITACAADDSVLKVQVPNVHEGDLIIADAATLDAHRCTQVIRGSLTIPDSDLMAIDLPALTEVTGNVELYMSFVDVGVYYQPDVRALNMPLLTRIGGSLSYETDRWGTTAGIDINLALNSLAHVRGDLSISLSASGVSPEGLDSLREVRDLELSFTSADVEMRALTSLTHARNVNITGGLTVVSPFLNLQEVSGNLRLERFATGAAFQLFPALQRVGGSLEFDNTSTTLTWMPELTHTGGLVLRRSRPQFGPTDAWSVRVPSLSITDSPGVALSDNLRLTRRAPVTILDSELTAAELCGFLESQPDYSGVPTPNLGGVTCAGLP